ncbi:MAG: response regulator transcription factor [Chlorobi bacterium]|nr:response regulator transcription factor [Chlorobiota bacterium]
MNCIIIDDDPMSRKVLEDLINRTDFLTLTNSYSNAIEAMNAFQGENEINLIFLDVEMPEMSGLDFLKTLENPPQIIIVSGEEKYALEAFEYEVVDYLLKPVTITRFYKSVNKAYKRYTEKNQIEEVNNEIFIKKKNATLVRLSYDDILWVEALENYVIVSSFDDKYTIHFTMKAITQKLPQKRFKRVHRSYIVNISKISVIEDNSVVIKTKTGSKIIPIGKSYKERLMEDLNLMSK